MSLQRKCSLKQCFLFPEYSTAIDSLENSIQFRISFRSSINMKVSVFAVFLDIYMYTYPKNKCIQCKDSVIRPRKRAYNNCVSCFSKKMRLWLANANIGLVCCGTILATACSQSIIANQLQKHWIRRYTRQLHGRSIVVFSRPTRQETEEKMINLFPQYWLAIMRRYCSSGYDCSEQRTHACYQMRIQRRIEAGRWSANHVPTLKIYMSQHFYQFVPRNLIMNNL